MPQFTNQAQLSYNRGVVNSNVAVGQILDVLSVTKTALLDEYAIGSSVVYAISLVNSGTASYTNLTLTDDLGAYAVGGDTFYPLTYSPDSILYLINGVPQADPAVTAGPPLTVSGISVPAGGNATVIYQTSVNTFADPQPDGSITNTVTVSGGISPITASETVTVTAAPALTVTKSISPVPVAENGRLTYTFLIQNTGNTPVVATDDASVTDLFDPILSDLAVTFDGVAWTEGANYTYNEATGLFTTVPGEITVPAASFVQNPDGSWSVTPGTAVLTVSGNVT